MRKYFIAAIAALAVPLSVADDEITNDAQGYCIANHLQDGWSDTMLFTRTTTESAGLRSEQTGSGHLRDARAAGNRVPVKDCITDHRHRSVRNG